MPKLTFYRQERADGGVRTGLSIDGDTALESFEEGKEESDPRLYWFVDVRAHGRHLPRSGLEARQWFREHAGLIQTALRELASELRAGLDFDSWPLRSPIPDAPRGTRMEIVFSVSQRLLAREAGKILTDVAQHWNRYLDQLQPYEPARR